MELFVGLPLVEHAAYGHAPHLAHRPTKQGDTNEDELGKGLSAKMAGRSLFYLTLREKDFTVSISLY